MTGARLEQSASQRLEQGLMMTPVMQQAIAILLMSTLELEQHVNQELETNPTLEALDAGPEQDLPSSAEPTESPGESEPAAGSENEPDTSAPEEPAAPESLEASRQDDEFDYSNLFSDSDGRPSGGGGENENENVIEQTMTEVVLLSDHLLEQLALLELPDEIDRAARAVVTRLDANGFLGMTPEDFAAENGLDPSVAVEALRAVKSLDPAGVGATDIRECLLLQLERKGMADSIAHRIIAGYFDDLAMNRLPAIAKALATDIPDINAAVDLIRTLEPHPGRSFGSADREIILPDVIVEKVHGEYIVSLTRDRVPSLRISNYYQKLYEQERRKKGEVSDYLRQKLESAFWLIKSIHQRQTTLHRVACSIVKHQQDFLDYGPKYLKPMTLRVVAEDLGIHESTVSRVTTQKYMQTDRGIFELKYFFTSPIETSTGEDASSKAVKTILSEIIGAEDPKNPLSDQKLAEMLSQRGFTIARRTVTKYREQMNILPMKQRIRY